MKTIFFLLGVLFLNNAYAQISNKYSACCGAEPVEFTHADMSIFVPNVFTPNKDGLNDLFFPHISGKVAEVLNFTIYTGAGDTVLFYRNTIVQNKLDVYGWDGMRQKTKEPYIGAFKYSMMIVNKQGNTELLYGRACRLECSTDADALLAKAGCYYPDQAGINGKADKTKKTKEKKCK